MWFSADDPYFRFIPIFACGYVAIPAVQGIARSFYFFASSASDQVWCDHGPLISFDLHHTSDINKVSADSVIAAGITVLKCPARPWSSHRSPADPIPSSVVKDNLLHSVLSIISFYINFELESQNLLKSFWLPRNLWRNVALWNMFLF